MAWETRRGRKYYYRSRRVGGRVVKQYFGRGPVAELAAAMDADQRARRAAEAEVARCEQARLEPVQAATSQLDDVCDLLVNAMLISAGYHRPNYGPWRRRRAQS
jgi:hypothetical protein